MNKIYLDDKAEKNYGNCDSLCDLASNIKAKIQNDDTLFIYINLKFHNNKRTEQTGIELLIWLRIKGAMNHCILYSFETLHSLLNRQPKYLIATSKGTSFVQLPINLDTLNFPKLVAIEAEPENLKIILKPSFNIESIRHQQANWWGIKKLWDVHRIMIDKNTNNFPYPVGVLANQNDLNSQLGVFIYDNNITKLGNIVHTKIELKEKSVIKCKIGNVGWTETVINDLSKNNYSYKQASISIIHILEERRPKILHIDDQWEDGWGEILCKMIYGENPNPIDNIGNYMVSVKPIIDISYSTYLDHLELNKYDLIILDLRLDPLNDVQKKAFREISGAIMLNKIRKKVIGIPVLMTTASNKMWSYEELMKLGADAYWMKEGIDNYFSTEETVKNYYRLLSLVESMTSYNYKLLKHFEESIADIKANKKWFKSQVTWKNGETKKPTEENVKNITGLLDDGILMFRTFLHQSFLGHSFCTSQIDSYWLSGLVNKLGGIVEEIHFPGIPGFDSSTVGGKWSRNLDNDLWEWKISNNHRQDWMGFILLNFRNAASHNKMGKELNYIKPVAIFFEILLYWLNMKQFKQFIEPDSINNTSWNRITEYTIKFLKKNNITLPNIN